MGSSNVVMYNRQDIDAMRRKGEIILIANRYVYRVNQGFISCHPGGEDAIAIHTKKRDDHTADYEYHHRRGKAWWKCRQIGRLHPYVKLRSTYLPESDYETSKQPTISISKPS